MKNVMKLAAVLALLLTVPATMAFAAVVKGTVSSTDATASTIEISTEVGSESLSYDASTVWPEGTTDPASLTGTAVEVETDDTTGAAVSVSLVQ